MPNVRLSQSRIEALRPRRSAYDVRNAEPKGFGVRVLPSGSKRFFIHSQYEGRRIWKTVSGHCEPWLRNRTQCGGESW